MKKEIIVADSAGFCFGVKKAVDTAYQLAKNNMPAVTLGELIHNSFVTSELEANGIRVIENPSQAKKGETVIIRAHGVPEAVYDEPRQSAVP